MSPLPPSEGLIFNNFKVLHERKVAGRLFYSLKPEIGGSVMTIRLVTVNRQFRGMGYGTKLLDNALTFAKDPNNNVKLVCLCATGDSNNLFSVAKWYRSRGFVNDPAAGARAMKLEIS